MRLAKKVLLERTLAVGPVLECEIPIGGESAGENRDIAERAFGGLAVEG